MIWRNPTTTENEASGKSFEDRVPPASSGTVARLPNWQARVSKVGDAEGHHGEAKGRGEHQDNGNWEVDGDTHAHHHHTHHPSNDEDAESQGEKAGGAEGDGGLAKQETKWPHNPEGA